MKAKRIFAILLGILLIMSAFPMVASVASSDTEVHGGDGGILLPTISYTQLREAALPTSTPFTFTLDPQGMSHLTNEQRDALAVEPGGTRLGEIAVITPCSNSDCDYHYGGGTACNEVTGWKLLDTAGQIIFSTYAPCFINNSNFDVALEIEFSFDAGTSGVVVVGTPEAAVTGTARNIFIGAVFSSDNVNTTPTDFTGNLTLPLLAAPQKPLFLLGAAEYTNETTVTRLPDEPDGIIQSIVVEQRKTKAAGDTGHGTQLTLVGICNPNADWSGFDDYVDELSINIRFTLSIPTVTTWSFTAPSPFVFPGTPIPGAYALVEGNGLTADDFITWIPPVYNPIEPPIEPPIISPSENNLPSGFMGTSIFPVTNPAVNEWRRDTSKVTLGVAGVVPFRRAAGVTIDRIVYASNGNIIATTDYTFDQTNIIFTVQRMNNMKNDNAIGAEIVWLIYLSDDPEFSYALTWVIT
ncbi:MAG: hypothetical protein FWE83_08975 [Oscillospiraceae bacterium]|nr:hypothetical protein [Oscillospiraceae bacterium]